MQSVSPPAENSSLGPKDAAKFADLETRFPAMNQAVEVYVGLGAHDDFGSYPINAEGAAKAIRLPGTQRSADFAGKAKPSKRSTADRKAGLRLLN
jgi:hypothetical protein